MDRGCNDIVWGENDVKLFGIKIDNELKFDSNIPNICRLVD